MPSNELLTTDAVDVALGPPRLSVVMPCFNEEATIERGVRRLVAQPFVAEVIVVDDGSTDGTAAILSSIDDRRVVVVRHPVNQGKGAALRTGFALATSAIVAVQDADLEYDPADLSILLGPLVAGDADVVYGSRFLTTEARRVLYFWHSVANKGLTLYSNMLTNLNLTDMETCYKVFRREVLDQIVVEEDRFGVEPELTAKVAALGCRIFEIGISYHGRSYAEGKKVGWRDAARAVWAISKYAVTTRADRNRRRRQPRDFTSADSELADTLDSLDEATHYGDWIASLVAPYMKGRILEVGAGHGSFSDRLAAMGGELVVCEPSDRGNAVLKERFGRRPDVTVLHADLAGAVDAQPFDSIVLINVLEHIDDDEKALRLISNGLRPGGHVALFVPAFEMLYSRYDHAIGHHRRYRAGELGRKVEKSGMRVVESKYVNSLGFMAWLGGARILGLQPTKPVLAQTYDRLAVPIVRRAEARAEPRFGQSLFVAAVRE
jgi:SAM-dependent methyltransferase